VVAPVDAGDDPPAADPLADDPPAADPLVADPLADEPPAADPPADDAAPVSVSPPVDALAAVTRSTSGSITRTSFCWQVEHSTTVRCSSSVGFSRGGITAYVPSDPPGSPQK
jgi:hypothetical protein